MKQSGISFSLVEGGSGRSLNITEKGDSFIIGYPCDSPSICTEYETTLPKGRYLLEVWGGEGGTQKPAISSGGLGGYSRGILSLSGNTKVFISIGSKGFYSTKSQTFRSPTFGGGGKASFYPVLDVSSNGGGSSDIRVLKNSLSHRVIVGGGGGGTGFRNSQTFQGGFGGGETGSNGVKNIDSNSAGGYGGSQTNGGQVTYGVGGSFGFGGYATPRTDMYGCGGGGGWFGGSSGYDYAAGGGGGSGFVLTSKSTIPTEFALTPKEPYFLTESETITGNISFSNPFGQPETGHSGSGFAKITILYLAPLPYRTYDKMCSIRLHSMIRTFELFSLFSQSLLFK